MSLEIRREGPEALPAYASVPMTLRVERIYRVAPLAGGLGGLSLDEVEVEPWTKDYDAHGGPTSWTRWGLARWGILSAFEGERRLGGAAVAVGSPTVHELEGRDDLASLWDLRVAPDARGRGVGRALFRAAVVYATEQGCVRLKVETQNINVPACRLYQSEGCELVGIRRGAYPELPDEVRLDWALPLLR